MTQAPEVPGSVAVGLLTLLSNGDALTAAVLAGARHPPGLLTRQILAHIASPQPLQTPVCRKPHRPALVLQPFHSLLSDHTPSV